MKLSIPLLLLASSIVCLAQQPHTVSVVATSLVITPYQTTSSSEGHSYTNCSGNSSAFGNFSNSSVRCSSTEEPPTEVSITHHIYTYYTVLRDSENSYLVTCTRKFVWDRCPTVLAGQNLEFSVKGSKIHLQIENKDNKFDLVQSVPNSGITSASANVAAVAGQLSSSPAATVHVHVACDAGTCDIAVDGDFVGNAPSDLQLTTGKHKIVVSKDGFTSWERQLTVSTGDINLTADLHPVAGK